MLIQNDTAIGYMRAGLQELGESRHFGLGRKDETQVIAAQQALIDQIDAVSEIIRMDRHGTTKPVWCGSLRRMTSFAEGDEMTMAGTQKRQWPIQPHICELEHCVIAGIQQIKPLLANMPQKIVVR